MQFQGYMGRPNQGQEHGLGERVVKELSRDLVNGNHHLYFDNFFSSYKLMKDLLEDNIYATATTRERKRASTEIEVRDGKSHFPVCVTLSRCSYCASRGQRHNSSWGCALCVVTLCVGCFEPYFTT